MTGKLSPPYRRIALILGVAILAAGGLSSPTLAAAPPTVVDNCWHALTLPSTTPTAGAAAVSALGPNHARVSFTPLDLVSPDTNLQVTGSRVTSVAPEPTVPWDGSGGGADGSANWDNGGESSFSSDQEGWTLGNLPIFGKNGIFGATADANLEVRVMDHWHDGHWLFEPLDNATDFTDRPGQAVYGVETESANSAWVVGSYRTPGLLNSNAGAMIQHWDGHTWTTMPNPLASTDSVGLYGISERAADDVWAVGLRISSANQLQPIGLHWNGSAWTQVHVPSGHGQSYLRSITTTPDGSVWATGAQTASGPSQAAVALVEKWTGNSWVIQKGTPHANALPNSIYAASNQDVWITQQEPLTFLTGKTQTFLHYDGDRWSEVAVPDTAEYGKSYLYGSVQGSGPNDVWATGVVAIGETSDIHVIIAHRQC